MTPRPWIKAVPIAAAVLVGSMAAVEVQAKVSKYGWDLSDWPLEVSFLTDSAGHNLFFLLFILPAFFAVYLAVARHGEDPSE